MTDSSIGDVLRHLRRLAGGREAPDEVLLARVAERADPEAFEALVYRPGAYLVPAAAVARFRGRRGERGTSAPC